MRIAFGNWARLIGFAALMVAVPQTVVAQQAAEPAAATAPVVAPDASAATAAGDPAAAPALDSTYVPMKPTPGKGMPVDGGIDFQTQYSDVGQDAYWLDTAVLLPIITIICIFVLGLMLWASVRFRAKANPVPSKVTHNSVIEVIWTLVPVIILVGVAIPSISLLAKQYKPAPEGALTVKVTGYQWYWGYSYPDNGDIEVVSNMLSEEEAIKRGEPSHLAVDNRMVVPAGETIKVIVTGSDVIHSFAVPSLWFKMDAVPGRLNEKTMFIKEPGVYYGQCSELCGARHGFMPIAVEALPRPQFEAWVRSQGGTVKGDAPAAATPATSADASTAKTKLASN